MSHELPTPSYNRYRAIERFDQDILRRAQPKAGPFHVPGAVPKYPLISSLLNTLRTFRGRGGTHAEHIAERLPCRQDVPIDILPQRVPSYKIVIVRRTVKLAAPIKDQHKDQFKDKP
jgi:hypothetical protein